MLEQFFDHLQYGFKHGKGCQKALLTVECTIDYFIGRESVIYMATLDARKVFDRINYYDLFLAPMKCNIPLLTFFKSYCVLTFAFERFG